ncbi:cupin domain-containing protein [Maritalea mediterranea]|uniref:Cupin domain-containing protein n=1 Tax=Maritalea mediterranea TaxID=2909667 RepID=A0ABS9E8F0_9HYPH|nr:cupin domain-containing protein [Maritalea mediterranea]MCF4099155.1 cupin domain-containing protein [Maritalea mediterranea]
MTIAASQTFAVGGLIREQRRRMKLTLTQLGERAGVSAGYLSQVERENAVPSLATLGQIALALGLEIEHFISMPKATNAITRKENRATFHIGDSSVVYEKLAVEHPANELYSLILTIPPGYQSEVAAHEGEEIIYVLEGQIRQTIADASYVLGKGDSLHFRGSLPHSWSNPFEGAAKIIWTGTLTLFRELSLAKN